MWARIKNTVHISHRTVHVSKDQEMMVKKKPRCSYSIVLTWTHVKNAGRCTRWARSHSPKSVNWMEKYRNLLKRYRKQDLGCPKGTWDRALRHSITQLVSYGIVKSSLKPYIVVYHIELHECMSIYETLGNAGRNNYSCDLHGVHKTCTHAQF